MRETLDGFQDGLQIKGRMVTNHPPYFGGSAAYSEQLEQVDTFQYLGSLITEDGECTTDFCTRLNRGKVIGALLQKIWKSHSTKEWQWHQLGHMQLCTLLQTDNLTSTPPLFYQPDTLPAAQPTASKH